MLIKNILVYLTLTKDFKGVFSSFCKFRWPFMIKDVVTFDYSLSKIRKLRKKQTPKANLPEFDSPVDDVLSSRSSRFTSMQAGKLIKAAKWNNH